MVKKLNQPLNSRRNLSRWFWIISGEAGGPRKVISKVLNTIEKAGRSNESYQSAGLDLRFIQVQKGDTFDSMTEKVNGRNPAQRETPT